MARTIPYDFRAAAAPEPLSRALEEVIEHYEYALGEWDSVEDIEANAFHEGEAKAYAFALARFLRLDPAEVSGHHGWELEPPQRKPLAVLMGVRIGDLWSANHALNLVREMWSGVADAWTTDGCGWTVWSEALGSSGNDEETLLVTMRVDTVDLGHAIAKAMLAAGVARPYMGGWPRGEEDLGDLFAVITNAEEYMADPVWEVRRSTTLIPVSR